MVESQEPFNPFPGLRPFEQDEDYLFFGREELCSELLRRLRQNRFLAAVGTSGSGKSSLIRAGLLPALTGGFMAGTGSNWRIALFRPGDNPIAKLAGALIQSQSKVVDVHEDEKTDVALQEILTETTLRRSSLGLVEAARQARMPAGEGCRYAASNWRSS